MSKELYNDLVDLRNRLSIDGSQEMYDEDHQVLDRVLDIFDLIDSDLHWGLHIDNEHNATVEVANATDSGFGATALEAIIDLLDREEK